MSLDLFDLPFKPFPVLVDHDGVAVENAFAAQRHFLAVPVHQSNYLPDLGVGLPADITSNVHL